MSQGNLISSLPVSVTFGRYSVAMQVICDVDKHIIDIHIGYPGSCADSYVFKQMPQYNKPHLFYSPGEYLLADSAYSLSTTCIPSYKAPAVNRKDNKEFNYCLAKSQVRNEHCIGILKSWWSSLQEMGQHLRSEEDMQQLIRWGVACCVLHNMLAQLGDAWSDIYLEDGLGVDAEDPAFSDAVLRDNGASVFKEALKKVTLETNYTHSILPL